MARGMMRPACLASTHHQHDEPSLDPAAHLNPHLNLHRAVRKGWCQSGVRGSVQAHCWWLSAVGLILSTRVWPGPRTVHRLPARQVC